jgi:N-acetylmuramoyl-L-alanine amidase
VAISIMFGKWLNMRPTPNGAQGFDLSAGTPDGLEGPHLPRRAVIAGLTGLVGSLVCLPALANTLATGVRLGSHDTFTRVVLDLSQKVDFSLFTLPEPFRVVVDLPEIDWQFQGQGVFGGNGMITALRYGLFQPGNSRIVFDLSRPASIKQAFVLPPGGGGGWRFVMDLEGTSAEAFLASSGPTNKVGSFTAAKEAEVQEAVVKVPEQPRDIAAERKPVIVLDPGHGGVDPGAVGVSGVYEKNLTLSAAHEFKKILERSGKYTVKLTRERDVFLKLRERIGVARRYGADLFISIHADSNPSASVKGLSVYTLSEKSSDSEAAALADAENKADIIAGIDLSHESPDVTNILIDLAQRETMNLSSQMAETMVEKLRQEVTLLRRSHRYAGFAVLKAPDVPSVLMEMGYLSNAEEERLLRTSRYRAKLGDSLHRAVDHYFLKVQKASRG